VVGPPQKRGEGPLQILQEGFVCRAQVLQVRADAFLAAGRQVVIAGDFNISPARADHCDPCPEPEFCQRPHRKWLRSMLRGGGGCFVDSFRKWHPHRSAPMRGELTRRAQGMGRTNRAQFDLFYMQNRKFGPYLSAIIDRCEARAFLVGSLLVPVVGASCLFRREAYSCWSTASSARVNNYGTRIDLILYADPPVHDAKHQQSPGGGDGGTDQLNALDDACVGADVCADVYGSDHAPVFVDLRLPCGGLPSGSAYVPPALSTRYRFTGRITVAYSMIRCRQVADAGSQEGI
jgi:Endonuclease/Exonuclease/phosphatase family